MSSLPAPKPSPAPDNPGWLASWPRSAQLTTAFLLGVALTLLLVQFCGSRFGGRPAELERTVYRVDLNRAERAEFLQLPGVGTSLADRLVEYRSEHGSFRNIDDLRAIHGFGPATVERLRPWVFVADDDIETKTVAAPATPRGSGRTTKKETDLKEPIDINRASATELQRLPGIGPKLSQAILDERGKSRFKTVDDLRRVSGIGPKRLAKLRPLVIVASTETRLAQDEP